MHRLPGATRHLLKNVTNHFQEMIVEIAEGRNPHVRFPFTEIRIIRGTHPHPPNSDLQEVRNSITLEFLGTPRGVIKAHLFNDGTIKESTEMQAENNRRRELDQRLIAEESKFPTLVQTAARRFAEARKMARIQAVRSNQRMSMIAKQLEKDSAEQELQVFLRSQEQARIAAAQAAAQAAERQR